ncbi:MAG: hypothetical protein IJT63_00870 [Lachnospiraceae bacterium]|nr:hypothetical protein [Lachnospiraceae bacterium]
MILEIYKSIMSSFAGTYMLNQVLTILVLFLMGLLPMLILKEKISYRWILLSAFPLGLSLFGVLGFLLLITGIRFDLMRIIIAYVIVLLIAMLYGVKSRGSIVNIIQMHKVNINPINIPVIAAAVIIPAVASCSGILPQVVTNDSVYYYSVYPSILLHDGFYTASLDKYLTNVGQTTAIIQCLPFMLGFDETFGIQHFFNMNSILIFFAALYDEVKKNSVNRKTGIILSSLCTLFLITSEPFLVISSWILSNVYFMGFFFTVFYIFVKTVDENADSADYYLLLVFLCSMLIMTRMEGGVMVLCLALALSTMRVSGKKLLLTFGLPLVITEVGYYVNLYLKIGINPLYSFLDMKTAVLMCGMIAAFIVYITLIRNRLPETYTPVLLIAALIAGNAGLLVINHSRYITNIRAFIMNIRLGNGWGTFWIMIVIYIVLLVIEVIGRRFRNIPVRVFLPAAMVLTVFAVCFARGGVLAVRTSDSGNRVLMEMVPVITYSVFVTLLKKRGTSE